MDTICESGEPDTTLEMFGHSYRIPVFAGPVGAMQLHYGTKYTDLEYNDILVPACHDAGILLSPVTAPIPRLWWVPARR